MEAHLLPSVGSPRRGRIVVKLVRGQGGVLSLRTPLCRMPREFGWPTRRRGDSVPAVVLEATMRQRRGTWRTVVTIAAWAVIAGPQWCCCTLETLAALPAGNAAAACCCCEAPASAAGSSSCPLESHPAGDDGCPCRAKLRPVATSGDTAVAVGQPDLSPWAGWQLAWPLVWGPQIGPDTASLGGRWPGPDETPRLSGRALLRALSTLRC